MIVVRLRGRLDHLLVRPVSRWSWLAGRAAVILLVLVGAGLVAGVATWLGAASQDAGVGFTSLIRAGLNVVPRPCACSASVC
jgi:putative exporter of polyketide antibiotics